MKRLLLILFFLGLSSCFGGIEKMGTVVRYHAGVVKTYGGGAFRVGALPASWQQKKIRERAVLFSNATDGASITLSSWCQSAFDDAPFQTLTNQLLVGIENVKRIEEVPQTLDGHEALQTSVTGMADGVSVYLRSYVLKANNCVFDFLYVSTPHAFESTHEFDAFVQGFQILKNSGKNSAH